MQRKKGFIHRCTALLVILCLMVAMLPQTAFAAGTDTGKAIQLGASNISGYDSTNGYDYIYYGNWTAPDTYTTSGPIKWRVLDDQTNFDSNSDGTNDAGLFLLSDGLLGTGINGGVYFQQNYHHDSSDNNHKGSAPSDDDHTNCQLANAWQGSDTQSWCSTFYSNNLTTQEQGAVLATTKSDGAYTSSTDSYSFAASANILNGDKVFFLSAEEAETSGYGFGSDNDRKANYGSYEGVWWFRSPIANRTDLAGRILESGKVHRDLVYDLGCAVRPAFNLNLNSVLFTSAAVGGKTDSTVDGDMTYVAAYNGNEWKLTLKDSNRNFSVTETALTAEVNGTAIFNYSGAQTGSNEYVSAMIVDSSNDVLYYGRVAQNSASGEASITIPSGLTPGSYTLKVFSEQYNGDKMTDYASAFEDISLTVTAETTAPAGTGTGKAIQLVENGAAANISGWNSTNGYDYIYYGYWTAPDTYTTTGSIKWRVLSMIGNRGTYSDGTETVDANNAMFLLSDVLFGTGTWGGVCFDSTSPYSSAWQDSDAQAWCSTFYNDRLTTQEQGAVLATTKRESEYTSKSFNNTYGASSLSADKVFFLSAQEVETTSYGFSEAGTTEGNNTRVANYNGSAGYWWLRSSGSHGTSLAGIVYDYGRVGFADMKDAWAARPAFNLNLNSVLFTSAADGGKVDDAVDSSLTSVADYNGNEWKLTLLDSSRESFSISNATTNSSGDTIAFSYSGAQTGTNEYISVVIEDNGAITHYGRILQPESASGTASLTLPAGIALNDNTKLYVFNEQYNGDKMTDYASQLREISSPTVDNTAPKLSNGSATRDSETTATVKFTSDEAGSYYYVVNDSETLSDSIDTSGEGTPCSANTETTISLDSLSGEYIHIVVKDAVNNVSDILTIQIPTYVIIKDTLGAAQNLAWSSETPGTATWSAVEHADSYTVKLYKDSETQASVTVDNVTDTTHSFTINEAGSYTFTVTAVANTDNQYYVTGSESVKSAALHTVSFDSNGGGDIAMQLIKDGEKVQEPEAPEILGLTLEGWYDNASFSGNAWDFENDTVTKSMTLCAKYDNTPKYTVTIPASVTLGGSAAVSATGVNVASGGQLEVALTATSGTNNAFTLTSGGAAIDYTVQNSSKQTISINDTVLTVAGGVANNTGSETLTFLPPDIIYYSGNYTGTVTFTVRVAE